MFTLFSLMITALLWVWGISIEPGLFFWLAGLSGLLLIALFILLKPLLISNLLRASKHTTSRLIEVASSEVLWQGLPMGCLAAALLFMVLGIAHPFAPFVN